MATLGGGVHIAKGGIHIAKGGVHLSVPLFNIFFIADINIIERRYYLLEYL